ncbi:MAG: hypothetical protein JNL34_07685, partial [Anaerolineae bacterium]|nr:hypothetical protein [Anaerolineae bacterium]
MRKLLLLLIAAALSAAALAIAPVPARAQAAAPQACQATVQQSLEALAANCTGVGRNTACYANIEVNSTFTEPMPEGYFSQPADRADLVTLQTLATSPMDEANGIWGVALMNLQANLPGTLPGQSVTIILLGDTLIGNAVPPAEAALPFPPLAVLTSTAANILTLPETGAVVAGSVPVSTTLQADARTQDNQWVRVASLTEPVTASIGGWVSAADLVPFDLSELPVVTLETRTPMQAFVFRTGIGQPTCAEAPNSIVVQGPNNTQVLMNVNGADLTVGSTVRLTSVEGAPQEILDTLDLPDEVAQELGAVSGENGNACGVMAMNVLSGAVEVNEGGATLPAGNTAFAVYCEEQQPGAAEATPEPGSVADLFDVNFASDWGAFQPMTEEELAELAPLETVGGDILNYPIELPNPDDIQPPIITTPTPVPLAPLGPLPATATPEPTLTPSPIPNPTLRPGVGQSASVYPAASANNQVMGVGQPFTVPFSVAVYDIYGEASVGTPVTFTAPASGASGTFAATGTATQTVLSDASGTATASAFTANTVAGSYAVQIAAPQGAGSYALAAGKDWAKPAAQATLTASINATNAPGAPALISAAPGGSGLSATVNTVYSAQPAALITDIYSNPVPFVPVLFTVIPGGSGAAGLFSGLPTANGVTGFNGIASAPFLTANTIAGAFQVNADAGFANVNLGMSNTPDVPAALTATFGGGQSATVTAAFSNFLVARLTDAYGNGVPAQSVVFNAPVSGPGAGFLGSGTSSETNTTDSGGYATTSAVLANTVAGSYNATASFGAFNASFGLTNTAGAPASLSITGGNGQTAVINTAFATALSVNVVDSYGNPAAGASVTFTPPGSGASGTFSGGPTVTADGSGNATASAFTANNAAGAYTVGVASGAAAGSFNLTNHNPQPVISGISPTTVTAGGSAFTLNLSGSGFVPGMVVTWTAQSNLAATVLTATTATVSVPASYINLPGTPGIGLSNPGPGGGASAGTQTLTIQPSTVITSLADSGPGSLRQIVADAPPGSTITFGVSGTITLTSGAIGLNKDLTLNGSNPYQVTISGNNTSQVFTIGGAGTDIAIYGIRVINGNAGGGDGGAIYVYPGTTLNMQYSVMENNIAGTSPFTGKGGAIFVDSASVIIFNSSLRNNTAGANPANNYGGAIALFNGGSVVV